MKRVKCESFMNRVSELFENNPEEKAAGKMDEEMLSDNLNDKWDYNDYDKLDQMSDNFNEKLSVSNKVFNESDDKSDKNESLLSDREGNQQQTPQESQQVFEPFYSNCQSCAKCNKNFVGKWLVEDINKLYEDFNKEIKDRIEKKLYYTQSNLFFIREIVEVKNFINKFLILESCGSGRKIYQMSKEGNEFFKGY